VIIIVLITSANGGSSGLKGNIKIQVLIVVAVKVISQKEIQRWKKISILQGLNKMEIMHKKHHKSCILKFHKASRWASEILRMSPFIDGKPVVVLQIAVSPDSEEYIAEIIFLEDYIKKDNNG
jgi:hypothetical protein